MKLILIREILQVQTKENDHTLVNDDDNYDVPYNCDDVKGGNICDDSDDDGNDDGDYDNDDIDDNDLVFADIVNVDVVVVV